MVTFSGNEATKQVTVTVDAGSVGVDNKLSLYSVNGNTFIREGLTDTLCGSKSICSGFISKQLLLPSSLADGDYIVRITRDTTAYKDSNIFTIKKEIIKNIGDTLKCITELKFSISKVSCDSGKIKSVTIENNGNVDIVEVTIRVSSTGEGEVRADKLYLTNKPMGPFEVKTFTSSSTPSLREIINVENPKKVEVVATISGNVLCTQNTQIYDLNDVTNC